MNSTRSYRLADSTLIEPLVNYWHAWAYLISPVPASLHLVHYQIPTMESYLNNPDIHAEAFNDPALICGPFIGVPPERASEVGALLERTKRKQSGLLRLAQTVREFHDWIVREAKGQSLEPFYQKAPEEFRGYIELIYDYYNRPTVRFLEGMLYHSDYYDPGLQSLRLSRLEHENSRPFFISTPRVVLPGEIDWTIPFADATVDELYRLDFEAQPLGHIRELLGLNAAQDELLLPLLTEAAAPPQETWNGTKPRVRYVGHACVLIEWKGVSILTDAFIPVMPVEGGLSRLTFQGLPRKIDYVLITHNHQDHFSFEALLRLRHRTGCLVVPKTFGISYGDVSLKLMMQTIGFKNVLEMDTFETIALPDGEIVALPFLGEHGDLPHGKTAYMVRAGDERIMFGADSDCLDRRMYDIVRRTWGRIETVFLGTECIGAPLDWVYGPLLGEEPQPQYMKTRRQHGCDASGALNMLEAVGAKRIYNYAMGLEPWMEYMLGLGLHDESPQIVESDRLLAKARGRGLLTAERTCGMIELRFDEPPAPPRSFQLMPQALPEDAPFDSPLSIAQEQLWLNAQGAPADAAENTSATIRLMGQLDEKVLAQCLAEIQMRQAVLRSAYPATANGEPTMVVAAEPPARLQIIDLGDVPETEREAEARKLAGEAKQQPFDLSDGKLIRALLLRINSGEHVLLLAAHRIICDRWSWQVIFEQLTMLYQALAEGAPLPASPVSVPYADFARTHRSWMQEGVLQAELAYWKLQLEGTRPPLKAHADQPLQPIAGQERGRHSFELSPPLSGALKELSEREGIALSTTLLAAVQTLLHLYTGQDEMIVQMLIRNREHHELEPLVGLFANTLALRTDFSGEPTFRTLLRRVEEVVTTAHAHRHVPFEMIRRIWKDETKPDPALRGVAMFVFDDGRPADVRLPHLSMLAPEIEGHPAGSDLAFFVSENEQEIGGYVEYRADLYDEHFIASLCESYHALLAEVAVDPDRVLAEIPLEHEASPEAAGGTSDAEVEFKF
jgi:L-ascorbate metabolism protein UlaG (beta-lactamase superfamily)